MQLDQLGRREFMALLGGAAAWPQTLLAQTPRQRPLVSLLLYAGSENLSRVSDLRSTPGGHATTRSN